MEEMLYISSELENEIYKSEYSDNNIKNIVFPILKDPTIEPKKRHRKGKNGPDSRNFKCSICQKTYLSSAALKNHKKIKHNYGKEIDKKGRGRPKKDLLETNYINNMKEKFTKFFDDSENKKLNNDLNNISFVKNIFNDLYMKYKKELFNRIDDIEKYNFYKLVIDNLEKENPNLEKKSYFSMINCIKADSIVDKPSIDEVFFLYIKLIYSKINKDYFSFVVKSLIIFREYINNVKKDSINTKFINENKKEYTQIYDSEIIPDLLNNFLMDFMESNNYFSFDKEEVITLLEYFCFWIYLEGYTNTHISRFE